MSAPLSLRSRIWSLQHRAAPYLFVLPFVLLFSIFICWPLVRSLILSTYKTVGPRHEIFAGLDNYRFILGDRLFWLAVTNTVSYTIAFLCLQIPLALGLAMLLNSKRVWARGAFRFAFFSTHLVGNVFVAVLFAQLLSPRSGLVNLAIGKLIGRPVEISWLGDPNLAMPSVLIAALWLSVGFGMIYFLAALQGVDQSLVEAARIDGAGPLSTFLNVTVPAIAPVTTFVVVTSTINSFQLFELPFTLLQNSNNGYGPDNAGLTIVGYLYRYAFDSGDLGTAAAVGWLLTCIILVVSLVQIKLASNVGSER